MYFYMKTRGKKTENGLTLRIVLIYIFVHFVAKKKFKKQAGAELGQAQLKLELGFTLTKI